MPNITLTYNPRNYGDSVHLHAYPNTFVQNNVPRYHVTPLDESRLNWYTNTADEIQNQVIDNREHDVNPNNGFHFHTPDPFSEPWGRTFQNMPRSFLSRHMSSPLFTDSHNHHWTAPDGRTGYHDYIFNIPAGRVVVDDGELRHTSDPHTYAGSRYDELVDDDLSNPNRFHGLYGLNQDGTLKNPDRKTVFDSDLYDYNDYTGTSYGEALHWLEVFATQASYNKTPAYIGLPHGLALEQFAAPFDPLQSGIARSRPNGAFVPTIDVYDHGWNGLAKSDVWQHYVQEHVIKEHGGFHDIYTPRAF